MNKPSPNLSLVRSMDQQEVWRHILGLSNTLDEEKALQNTVVWACVTLIADSMAQVPLRLFKVDTENDSTSHMRTHPLNRLMQRPSKVFSAFNFRRTWYMHLVGWGNAYARIERNSGGLVESLTLIAPDRVEEREEPDEPYRVRRTDRPAGEYITIQPENMLHVVGYSPDGINGWSPIRQHRETVLMSDNQASYAREFFKKGAKFTGLLETEASLSAEQKRDLRETFNKLYTKDGDGEGQTAVLEGGLKFNRVAPVSPDDAAYVASRKLTGAEITMIFRVPPLLVSMLESATFNNAAELKQYLLQFTLAPHMSGVESELDRKLLADRDKWLLFFEHDAKGWVRTSMTERYAAYRTAIMGGWMSPNEARQRENDEPIEGLDAPWRPSNVIAVGEEPEEPVIPPGQLPFDLPRTDQENEGEEGEQEEAERGYYSADRWDVEWQGRK